MPRPPPRTALVTGASSGIGLEVVRGLAQRGHLVYLTARDAAKASAAVASLPTGHDVRPLALDVGEEASIRAAAEAVARDAGRLDVLVNNAGVLLDVPHDALTVPLGLARATFEVNLFGAWAVTQAFAPLLRRGRSARVVNVSSMSGSLADLAGSGPGAWAPPAYCASKTALNALTILLARAFAKDRVLVNACCPGWVRTKMGGPSADLTPEEGADTPLWLATLPDDGPTGGFFSERRPAPW